MAIHEGAIVQQCRIPANLFADFAMFVEKAIEARDIPAVPIAPASVVTIAIEPVSAIVISAARILPLPAGIAVARIVIAVVSILKPHKCIWLLADLLFHTGMFLEIRVELTMAIQELRVVNQRRRSAKLFGGFAMAIEKLVEPRQISARNVIVLRGLPVL
jgi:hypothetical protein